MKFFALLREPSKSVVNAIALDPNHSLPDYEKVMNEYREYIKALEKTGLSIKMCPADEAFPDGHFVEDPYFVLSNKLIIELNPGASSRKNEFTSLQAHLLTHLPLRVIPKEFTIDGGDILKDGKNIYIGLSTRTSQAAIDAFESIVIKEGYVVHALPVPEGLHLKSGLTRVMSKNYVIQESFEPLMKIMQEKVQDIRYFIVPEQEKHAANVLAVNGHILLPDNCPHTKAYVEQFYQAENIHEVSTQQVRLVDGALTCSSLLF